MPMEEKQIINRVLFVDDEIQVLNALKRGLHHEPYVKFFAVSAAEALEIMRTEDIHVIVTDMKMPGMNGLELLKVVKVQYPEVVKIILSGFTHLPQIIATINQVDIFKFITKPWDMETDFIIAVRSAIAQYNLIHQHGQMKALVEKKNSLYLKLIAQNEERLKSLRIDFDNIKSLNKDIFELLKKKNSSEGVDALARAHDLDYLSQIVDFYIDTLPTEMSEFNLSQVKTELEKYLKSHEEDANTILSIRWLLEGEQFRGNFRLLVACMLIIIKFMFVGEEKHITLNPSMSETEEESHLMIDFSSIDSHFENDRHRLESLMFVVGRISKLLHAGIRINKAAEDGKENHHLELKMTFAKDTATGR